MGMSTWHCSGRVGISKATSIIVRLYVCLAKYNLMVFLLFLVRTASTMPIAYALEPCIPLLKFKSQCF